MSESVTIGFGQRLTHSTASSIERTCQSQNPATNSFVSANGPSVVRDGPFAEAKEMIGGFLLLTCNTREEAVAIARECPAAEWAAIEVREFGPCFQ